MPRVEVITGPERRRQWSEEQKRAIAVARFAPGAVVCEVARRAEVSPGQIYRWRQELPAASAGFAQVLIAPAESPISTAANEAGCGEPAIEVEFAGKTWVRIPGRSRGNWRRRSSRRWRGDDPGSERRGGVAGGRPHRLQELLPWNWETARIQAFAA